MVFCLPATTLLAFPKEAALPQAQARIILRSSRSVQPPLYLATKAGSPK
ncbi:hypothetical protein [Synechococcus elongatus]|uniref:Uncharacterized protein n=1 Tax=Synechococcus elongatus PCC 11801 TaxID=2219813 RepID=A0AAQ3MBS0_SYNEL|nr:hypothetical protein [Synechococcus elongatus]